ncbi:hypothetical protein BDY19DRAFT_870792, partial [Irpex rosettiformis]
LTESSKRALEVMWKECRYFIIDEISMVERALLASLSRRLSIAKASTGESHLPFGGINVILCGDLHHRDNENECMGRMIWEMFEVVVQLSKQVRVKDPLWQDFLHHLRYGRVTEQHVAMLETLVLTNPVLVTPRHSVRVSWNDAALRKHCEQTGVQLFKGRASDTTRKRPLNNAERLAVINRKANIQGSRNQLPDEVNLAIGMKAMVTLNVRTELDITNGARGEVVDIVLDPEEPAISTNERVVTLKYPPLYILFKLQRTR